MLSFKLKFQLNSVDTKRVFTENPPVIPIEISGNDGTLKNSLSQSPVSFSSSALLDGSCDPHPATSHHIEGSGS